MAGEDYTSPITGLKYTVPKYEEPADAPLAFKDFADSIGPTGIDIDATRAGQVVQADASKDWAAGPVMKVVDAVPADNDPAYAIGDIVFVVGA